MSSGGRTSPTYKGNPGTSLTDAAVRDPKWTTPSASDGERGGTLTPGMSGTSLAQQVATPGFKRPELWQTPGTDSFRSRGGDRKDEMGLDQQARWMTPKASSGGANSKRLDRGAGGPDLKEQTGQWRTPTAGSPNSLRGNGQDPATRREGGHAINLQDQASHWPTPMAHDGRRPGSDQHSTQAGNLSRDAASWSTPRSSDGEKGAPMQSFGGGGIPLPAQAINWPTLAARDVKGINSPEHVETNGTGKMHMDQLPNFVEYAFLPSSPGPGTQLGEISLRPIPFAPLPSDKSISGELLAEILVYRRWSMRSGGAAGWCGTWTRRPRRSLNPRFVDWLMGMPIGLSGFVRRETEFSRWLPRMRGLLLAICLRPTEPQDQGRLL